MTIADWVICFSLSACNSVNMVEDLKVPPISESAVFLEVQVGQKWGPRKKKYWIWHLEHLR